LWQYMPYYKRDDACIWDLMVGLLIVGGLWWATKRDERAVARA